MLEEPLFLSLYVQPGASQNELAGYHDGHLKIRLKARAVEGAANLALIDFLATYLDLPKRTISIVGGEKSRIKRIKITNSSPKIYQLLLSQE